MNREPVLGRGLHDHGRCAGELHLLGNGGPVRRVRDDLVAVIEEHHRGVVERLLAARRHDDFLGCERDAVVGAVALADRLPQLEDAGRGRVLREVLVERGVRGVLHVLRRREVRLAGAEIDDVHALAAESIGLCRHLQGW